MPLRARSGFQFLGIPPKGEHRWRVPDTVSEKMFPISRDPPEGGTVLKNRLSEPGTTVLFPISRDPPEGGTSEEFFPYGIALNVSNF